MATLPNATRSAACDAVVDKVDQDAAAGKLKLYTSGASLLATLTLPDPSFGAAANGVATLNGVPISGTASASGTVDNYAVTDGADVVIWTGPVGEITIDNAAVNNGQAVRVTAMTFTVPAS